jgi:hypothetical protein
LERRKRKENIIGKKKERRKKEERRPGRGGAGYPVCSGELALVSMNTVCT